MEYKVKSRKVNTFYGIKDLSLAFYFFIQEKSVVNILKSIIFYTFLK